MRFSYYMFTRVNTAVRGASSRERERGSGTGVGEKLFNQIKTSLPGTHIVTAISFLEQNRELYVKFYANLFIMSAFLVRDFEVLIGPSGITR